MARQILVAVAIAGLLGACDSMEQRLEWVEDADPQELALAAASAGEYELFEVCGLACRTPGVDVITYSRCYAEVASVNRIDSSFDEHVSPRHSILKVRADSLAHRYNTLLVQHIKDAGLSHCGPGARWQELWSAIESVSGRAYDVSTSVGDRKFRQADFTIYFDDQADAIGAPWKELCALGPTYGIADQYTIAGIVRGIGQRPAQLIGIGCEDGGSIRLTGVSS